MLSTKPNIISKTSKILVIDEGFSAEKEVALRSGRNVANSLISAGYKSTDTLHLSSKEDLKKIIELKVANKIDLAILMTHGRFGEDGCIQGFLELLEIPYTGSNVKASANCMNKLTTKALLKANNLDVFPNLTLEDLLNENDLQKTVLAEQTQNNKFPIILKATAEGSSVGVEKINSLAELQKKLVSEPNLETELKAKTHIKTFIEPYTQGIEVTTSILPYDAELYKQLGLNLEELKNNPNLLIDGDLISLPILKLTPKKEFYDYEAKYTAGLTEFELPAILPAELTEKVHRAALKAYRTLECSGFARVDFIIEVKNSSEATLDSTEKIKNEITHYNPYILELNTLPGMTDTSDLPAQAKSAGIDSQSLIEILINSTLDS
jgi:D-alanine-D-alanine ligase